MRLRLPPVATLTLAMLVIGSVVFQQMQGGNLRGQTMSLCGNAVLDPGEQCDPKMEENEDGNDPECCMEGCVVYTTAKSCTRGRDGPAGTCAGRLCMLAPMGGQGGTGQAGVGGAAAGEVSVDLLL